MPASFQRCIIPLTLGWEALCCGLNPRRHWWDEIDPGVYLGAAPTRTQLVRLHALGVRGIVNLCLADELPAIDYAGLGLECLRLPTIDRTPPTSAHLQQALDFIARHRAANDRVYVHCRAGRGRGATIALCWLMQSRGLAPAAAYAELLKQRLQIDPALDRREVVTRFWSETVARNAAPTARA